MTISPILLRRYQDLRPFVEAVADKVGQTVLNYCNHNGYAIISRIKTVDSLAEKIETGRYKKWSDIDDLFGCAIIVPTLLNEEDVHEFCKDKFLIKRMIKRGQTKKDP